MYIIILAPPPSPLRATTNTTATNCRPRMSLLCRMWACSSKTSPSSVMGTPTICEGASLTFINADRYKYIVPHNIYLGEGGGLLYGGYVTTWPPLQVYRLLEEIKHYQKDAYKLHPVPELQHYLLTHQLCPEDDLHATSHNLEPRGIRRSHSSPSTKSLTGVQGRSFFRSLARTSSSGNAANRTSGTSTS